MGDLGDAYADAHLDLDSLDRDIDNATSMLRDAVDRWERLANVSGTVEMDTEQASSEISRAAQDWQSTIDRVSGAVAIDTGLASADIDTAAQGWEAAANVSGNVDMDTSGASSQIDSAVSEWEQLVNISGTVDVDTTGASAQIAAVTGELESLSETVPLNLEVDTAAVTAQIVAASSVWEAAAQVKANVDVNVSGLESFQALTTVLETLSKQTELFVRFELDNASVTTITGEIAAIVATWEAMLKVTPEIQSPDTSNVPSGRKRPGRNTPAAANAPPGIEVDVTTNTTAAYTEIAAAAAEWERILKVLAKIEIDDTALATEAATASGVLDRAFADIKALIDVDPAAAVAKLRGLGPVLADALGDIETRLGTDGLNEDLRLVIAELRAIASKEITVPFDVDTRDAVTHAGTFKAILDRLADRITTGVDFDAGGAAADAESTIALLQRVAGTVPVGFDFDEAAALSDAEVIRVLMERTLGALKSRVDVNTPEVLTQIAIIEAAMADLGTGEGVSIPVQADTTGFYAGIAGLAPPAGAGFDLPVGADPSGVDAELRAIVAEWERTLKVLADIEIDKPKLAAQTAEAARTLQAAVDNIVALIETDPGKAFAEIAALGPEFERLLGDITTNVIVNPDVDLSGFATALAEMRALADRKIVLPVEADIGEVVSKMDTLELLKKEIARQIKLDVKVGDFSGMLAAEAAIRELDGLDVNTDFKADTAGYLTEVEAASVIANRLLGTIHSKLELDGAPGYLAKLTTIKVATAAVSSGLSESVSGGLEASSGVFSGIVGQLQGVLGSVGEGLTKAAGNLPAMAAQFASMLGMVFLWVGVVAPLVASAVVGVGALIGTAAGFVTLAGSMAAAAGAAGLLGIALNADLLERVKTGLNELKTGVAAVTRDAGEQLISKFQGPFIEVLTNVAGAASKLTSVFIDPIAGAALDWLRTFNALLETPAAAEFTAGLGDGISRLIGIFNDFLPVFLDISNEMSGPLFDALAAVIEMFLELGVSGKDVFKEFFGIIEALAPRFVEMGEKSLPVIEALLGGFTDFINSDMFTQFIDFLGIAGQLVVKIIDGFSEGFSGVDKDLGTTNRTMEIFLSALSAIADAAPVIGAAFAYWLEYVNGLMVVVGFSIVGIYETIAAGAVVVLDTLGSLVDKAKGFAEGAALLNIPGANEAAAAFGLVGDKIGTTSDSIQSHMGDVAKKFHTVVTGLYSSKDGVEGFATSAEGLGLSLERAGDGAITASDAFDTLLANAKESDSSVGDMVRTFETSGKAYADFRAELEKPIELQLKVKFPDIKKIGEEIASQVKFTEETIPAIPAGREDGGTGTGASGPSGNGAIADALNQTQQSEILPEVPAKTVTVLSKTFQQATDETLKKANESVVAGMLADSYEKAGQAGLAAIVRGLTGPELQQAYKEFGEPGSESATEFSKKFNEIFVQQTTATGGGITGAIDKFSKDITLKMKKLDYLKILDAQGFDGVAAILSGLTGPDLEAAIQQIDAGGNAFLASTEKALDGIREGAKAKLGEDPLLDLREEADAISEASKQLDEQVASFAGKARSVSGSATGIASSVIGGIFGTSKPVEESAAKTKEKGMADAVIEELGSGFTTSAVAEAAAKLVEGLVAGIEGMIVGAAPRLSVAGALMNTYFMFGVNSGFAETSSAPFAAAVVGRVVGQLLAAVDSARAFTIAAGGILVENFADGIESSVALALAAAAMMIVTTAQLMGDTALFFGPQLMAAGRGMAQMVVDGINEVSKTTAAATGAGFISKLVEGLSGGAPEDTGGIGGKAVDGAREIAAQAFGGGKKKKDEDVGPGVLIGQAIGDGMIAGLTSRVPIILAAVEDLGNLIATTMKSSLKIKSPSQVTASIGEQVAEGLAQGIGAGQARAVASAQSMTDAVRGTLEAGVDRMTVLPTLAAADTAAALDGLGRGVVDQAPVLARPEVTLPESARLVGVQTISVADPKGTAATDITAPTPPPAAPTGEQARVFNIAKVEVTGVRDAENVPSAMVEAADTELWRLGYGESPRRN